MASASSSPAIKAVSISDETETFDVPDDRPLRRPIPHKHISNKRLQGRLPVSPSLAASVVTKDIVPSVELDNAGEESGNINPAKASLKATQKQHSLEHGPLDHMSLTTQVKGWIHQERQRLRARRERYKARHSQPEKGEGEKGEDEGGEGRSVSPTPSDEASLDMLEALISSTSLNTQASSESTSRRPSLHARRLSSSARKNRLGRSIPVPGGTSDTEYASDGEPLVPSCDVKLHIPEEVGTKQFKKEVLTLAHTLRCKGWRRISLERYEEIGAERISGALTNAVYMISPPAEKEVSTPGTAVNDKPSRPPATLLLRIYGPQVSHLIDRPTELSILRRLAQKRIGPRLLGTFKNGRFEQFFPSRTLTKEDIRMSETSRHISKRLKELHEGIDLEEEERLGGPIVWKNWYKWVPRAGELMQVVDVRSVQKYGESGMADPADAAAADWEKRGFVCGTTWDVFEAAVEKYCQWLFARYGGKGLLAKELVFAHNDTQYGNILRLHTSGKSPLLLPSNEHRQLVVIDFEYASANVRGYEFANHFCEWMADYHDAAAPYIMNTKRFPTKEEQRNCLRAYVEHSFSSSFVPPQPLTPKSSSASFVPAFTLDSRAPGLSYGEQEATRQKHVDKQVEKLQEEARIWRAASHAMWCAWGIVQAKIEDSPPPKDVEVITEDNPSVDSVVSDDAVSARSDMKDKKPVPEEGEDEEFDYLGYAQQRALLFWGDMLELGILGQEEMGERLIANAKRVEV